MSKSSETFFKIEEFVPSLAEAIKDPPPDLNKILRAAVAVREADGDGKPAPVTGHRNEIVLTDGKGSWEWNVTSLQDLFRGDKQPPYLGDYPEAYEDSFALLDFHVAEISNVFGDRRDSEMQEIFSQLRRRPDGKSLSFVHDYMWQAVALILGTRVLSRAEFEAIMARLERSCRRFGQGSTSRNYCFSLRTMLFKAER